jgi:hypothetical protein
MTRSADVMKAELAKLGFLRVHGADRLDLSALPTGRRRLLAEIGRRSTNQASPRADVERRHPVLLATLAETYVEVLDELVQLLDRALADADSRARHELSERIVIRARREAERGRLLDEILDVLADQSVPDDQAGHLVRFRIGWPDCRPDGGRSRTVRLATTAISICWLTLGRSPLWLRSHPRTLKVCVPRTVSGGDDDPIRRPDCDPATCRRRRLVCAGSP